MAPCAPFDNASANPFMALVDAATSALDESTNDNKPTTAVAAQLTPSASPPPPCVSPALDEFSVSSSSSSVTSKKNKESFADTLMNLLLNEEYSKIVTFLPDDQSFGIINAKVFADEVMPKVFGIRTFSSFVRKLTRWGFERIMEKKTHDVDVFRHDLFRKNDWKSCANVKCVRRSAYKQPEKPSPVVVMQQQVQRPTFIKTFAPAPTFHSQTRAIHDVTSEVVSAALATLRRDQRVAPPAPQQMSNSQMQQLIARQRLRAQMMALRHSGAFASQSMGMM